MTNWLRIIYSTGKTFLNRDVYSRDVPALTYSTLMALIPCLALMYVVARSFGCDDALEEWIRSTLESQPTVSEYLVDFVHNYLANTQSKYILWVGLVMMLFNLYSLLQKIENTFNGIWMVKRRRYTRTFIDYLVIFLFCGLMILIASGLNFMATTITHYFSSFTGKEALDTILLRAASTIPLFAFFVFLYGFMPNERVKIRFTLIPALMASLCMTMLQYFYISVQFWLSSYNAIYGSLAALPLFLLWLYYSWTICLFFAVLCYARQTNKSI